MPLSLDREDGANTGHDVWSIGSADGEYAREVILMINYRVANRTAFYRRCARGVQRAREGSDPSTENSVGDGSGGQQSRTLPPQKG